MQGLYPNVIGQPAVKIDGGIRIGVDPGAAADTFKQDESPSFSRQARQP